MTNIHPNIIVHWTRPQMSPGRRVLGGWDPSVQLTEDARDGYTRRLRSIYLRGLRASVPNQRDQIYGVNETAFEVPVSSNGMICFSEVRLDRVGGHEGKYGRLGIGFSRDWLLSCGANPVLYLQSARQGIVNTNMLIFTDLLDSQEVHQDIKLALLQFLTYVKPMSDLEDVTQAHYEDMEWRIVPAKMTDTLSGTEEWPTCFVQRRDGIYLPFDPEQVKLLITPDETTRRMALSDPILKRCFGVHLPMMIDFTEIGQF